MIYDDGENPGVSSDPHPTRPFIPHIVFSSRPFSMHVPQDSSFRFYFIVTSDLQERRENRPEMSCVFFTQSLHFHVLYFVLFL